MLNVFDVAKTLVNHIEKVYSEDIALVAYYGSYAQGTATKRSDSIFSFRLRLKVTGQAFSLLLMTSVSTFGQSVGNVRQAWPHLRNSKLRLSLTASCCTYAQRKTVKDS